MDKGEVRGVRSSSELMANGEEAKHQFKANTIIYRFTKGYANLEGGTNLRVRINC